MKEWTESIFLLGRTEHGLGEIKSIKGHLNEKTFHTIIETMKHGYAIRSGLGLVLSLADTDT